MVRNGLYEEVMCKQDLKLRSQLWKERSGENESRDKGTRCSVKSKKTCVRSWILFLKNLDLILQELPYGLKEATAIMEMRDGSGLN